MIKETKKGFTLMEMLVVVLIIGILAGIALPKYEMAVTKAKVASILPIMRRWKDALEEWKFIHGDYEHGTDVLGDRPSFSELGTPCPTNENAIWECETDYWYCMINEEFSGYVYCKHQISSYEEFGIWMFQSDETNYDESFQSGTFCFSSNKPKSNKICKSLGGKEIQKGVYKL